MWEKWQYQTPYYLENLGHSRLDNLAPIFGIMASFPLLHKNKFFDNFYQILMSFFSDREGNSQSSKDQNPFKTRNIHSVFEMQ